MEITFDDPQTESGDRGSNRRRWFAGVSAAMLVAAAGGVGYGIGRGLDGDDGVAVPAAQAGPDTDASDTAAPSVPASTVPDTTTAVDESSALEPTATYMVGDEGDDIAIASSGGSGWAAFGDQPMTPVFDRTTDDGFTLRAHVGQPWDIEYGVEDGYGGGPADGWQPAPWCYESGQIRVAVAGNGMVDVGSVPWYREPYQERSVSWVGLGAIDQQPRWVIVAQTPPGTTNVSVTFDDGATDAAAPQNGYVVLSAPGQAPTEMDEGGGTYWMRAEPSFEVTFEGADGVVDVQSQAVGTWNDPEFRASCQPPPPALPDAGEQPADPVVAESEITTKMTALYDSTVLLDTDVVYVDDDTGITEAREQIAEGNYSDEASSAQATIEELVFTSPAEAWFRYRVETTGVDLIDRYGIAVQIDGEWRITRATICQDLAMAGGTCVPTAEQIRPPSALDGGMVQVTVDD
ncbi:MAG: hypothetical protein WBP59_03820 [Ilumatobacteraceae bacterium]